MTAWRRPRLSAADRAAWRSARTLDDYGDRVADWLSGRIRGNPDHGNGRPDPETRGTVVRHLLRLNRSGLTTLVSQAGRQPGRPGVETRAWVEGLGSETTVRELARRAAAAGMGAEVRPPAASCPRRRDCPPGTCTDHPEGFPGWSRASLDLTLFSAPRDVREAAAWAWQLGAWDPVPGRDSRLWPVLTGRDRRPGRCC